MSVSLRGFAALVSQSSTCSKQAVKSFNVPAVESPDLSSLADSGTLEFTCAVESNANFVWSAVEGS